MNDSLEIQCPHCGESFTLPFDPSEGSTRFVYDCYVCCRPISVAIGVNDDGEIESVDASED